MNTVSKIITKEVIGNWSKGSNIIINSPTGTGKSYFVLNTLRSMKGKILFLTNRTILKKQIENKSEEFSNIDVKSYQYVEYTLWNNNTIDIDYDYIVFDECHYVFNDAIFNKKTELSLQLMEQVIDSNVTGIFMSATINNIKSYFKSKSFIEYSIEPSYSNISDLVFYTGKTEGVIQSILKDNNDKFIVFSNDLEELNSLALKYDGSFLCSQSNKKYLKRIDNECIDTIVASEKFNCRGLYTSTVMDNGINIIDRDVKHIIIDILDLDILIQCLGRKRFIDASDTITLYIKDKQGILNRAINNNNKLLEPISYIRKNGVKAYANKYSKSSDGYSEAIEITWDDSKAPVRINKALEYKWIMDLKAYTQLSKKGYKETLSKILLKRNYMTLRMDDNRTILNEYLTNVIGKPLFKDEIVGLLKELHIEFGSTGVVIKNTDVINLYFKMFDLKYNVDCKVWNHRDDNKNKAYWLITIVE